MPNYTRDQLNPVAEALANARGHRHGAPTITNVLDLLETTGNQKLINEVYEDAQASDRGLELAQGVR